jgi:hypothetical protein
MIPRLLDTDRAEAGRYRRAKAFPVMQVLIALALLLILLPVFAVVALSDLSRGWETGILLANAAWLGWATICFAEVPQVHGRLRRDGPRSNGQRRQASDSGWPVLGAPQAGRVATALEHLVRRHGACRPAPWIDVLADCFSGVHRGLLHYRPGISGPAQALFRHEKDMYPGGCDPEEFYRQVLFPTKARIDLAYYPERSWLSDVGWICRCVLAVWGVPVRRGDLGPTAFARDDIQGAG